MSDARGIRATAAGILFATSLAPISAQQTGCANRLAGNRSPVAPTHQQTQTAINEAHAKFNGDTSGKNADYIPHLAQVDSLANRGVNAVTGEQVIKPADIPPILAVMTMAGLYDGSGAWAWRVGLPVKGGVGGGILAIVPGKGAIMGFSPRLDQAGNSVKAQRSIDYVSEKLDVNVYSPQSVGLK